MNEMNIKVNTNEIEKNGEKSHLPWTQAECLKSMLEVNTFIK
jgi:hypothetical protein